MQPNPQPAKLIHLRLLTLSLALLIALPLSLGGQAQVAQAATFTISDQASCQSAGGIWYGTVNSCFIFSAYTVADGDVLQTTVDVDFVDSLTNHGTINFANGGNVSGDFVNHGTINITNRSVRLSTTSTNNGTITLSALGRLEIFPATAVLTNQNTIQINTGGTLDNLGTVENQGTITLACGGVIKGNPIQGNPVQAPADCTPPTASPTQAPAANAAGWNNSDVTVSWNWTDNAGIDMGNCPPSTTASGEGMLTLTATCQDLAGNLGHATYTVKVDQTPPRLSCSVKPNQLWPPNHKLGVIAATVNVMDSGSGAAGFQLRSVTSNEPDSGLDADDQPNDIQAFALGTADTTGKLRSERGESGSGRLYTLTYQGSDGAGNTATCSVTVTVPKTQESVSATALDEESIVFSDDESDEPSAALVQRLFLPLVNR